MGTGIHSVADIDDHGLVEPRCQPIDEGERIDVPHGIADAGVLEIVADDD
jgi:hypothetical protein